MPHFRYEAKRGPDEPVSGTIEAESNQAAIARLREMGCFPTEVTLIAAPDAPRRWPGMGNRLRLKDRNIFFRQLANLMASGMMLTRALRTIERQAGNPRIEAAAAAIREEVQRGASLAGALEKQDGQFPPLDISLVRAGETGGMLEEVLWRIVAFGEQEEELRGKAASALVYPAFLTAISAISVFILISFVFPRFLSIFEEFNAELPWPTLVVMALCRFMGTWWWAVLLAAAGAAALTLRWLRTDAGQLQRDQLLLRLPVIRSLVQKYEMARFARTFGTLLDNGVPILTTLEITAGALGNRVVRGEVARFQRGVAEGAALSELLESSPQFPPAVVSMFAVGEESGRIGAVAARVADAFDIEVERAVKAVVALFEPLLIVVMGVLIGFLVIAMLLPMLTLSSVVGT